MATSRSRVVALTLAGVLCAAGGSSLSAQQRGSQLEQPNPPGWVFTPAFSVAETWDNNVLLAGDGSELAEDFLTVFTPRGALGYRGRRLTLQLDYQASYQLYQQLTALNAFDQRSNVGFRHRLTPALTIFARNSFSKSPTTDQIELPGVEFRRQGVMMDDVRTGFDAQLTKRTSLTGAYTFQWVDFDENEILPVNGLTRGGHAHGASARLERSLSSRLTFGGEYDLRRGTVDEVNEFDVQNALGTVDWRLSKQLQLSAGAGVSWLSADREDSRRSAPAFRADLSGTGQRFGWNVGYRRAFLPSYGFGGTFENQEFSAGFLAALTRRLDWSGTLAYRVNDPLVRSTTTLVPLDGSTPIVQNDLSLESLWLRSAIGYRATRWIRVEAFYAGVLQDSQRAGGKVNRSRLGVQVVTSTRMRVR
jgi:hypothetical protein